MHGAIEDFKEKGFAVFPKGSIEGFDGDALCSEIEALERAGIIDPNRTEIQNLNDAVYLSNTIMDFAKDPKIVGLVESLLGQQVELQHSKMINKYAKQGSMGRVKWHQDYPFFPHTNYDMCALGFHFDDEFEGAGAIDFLEATHNGGLFNHCDPESGEFKYEIVDPAFDPAQFKKAAAVCSAGDITVHHGNTIHASSPISVEKRRVLYIQYRAVDSVQLAGALWRCTGMSPYEFPPPKRTVRFVGGDVVEVRSQARLFDQFGLLAPDGKQQGSIYGE